MSADLLAEFGASQSPASQETRPKVQKNSEQEILIPGLVESFFYKQIKIPDHQEGDESIWRNDANGTNVLFDASEEVEEDEFGDFEKVKDVDSTDLLDKESPSMTSITELTGTHTATMQNATLLDDSDCGTFEEGWKHVAPSIAISTLSSSKNTRASNDCPADEEVDEWALFEDDADTMVEQQQVGPDGKSVVLLQSPQSPQPSSITAGKPKALESAVRPTNVPPPALLLQILPGVFAYIRKAADRNDSPVQSLALNILQAFIVAARIVAGRSLRWKRDTVLAQSTKIGPAASGKLGGMKLASIDKSEAMKEEREASEAIVSWSRNTHVFNTVLGKASVRRNIMSIEAKSLPRILKQIGVLGAVHACALCGIRRDERLPGVDVDISDSFGEYWMEHWGHKGCQEFWETYKDLLHQR